MIGVLRNALKTRGDFEMLHQAALGGELRPHEVAELRRHWQALLDGRFAYEVDRALSEGESADGGEPEYRVMADEDGARTQYKLTESASSRLVALGFTVGEVEHALTELEGK